MGIGPPCPFPKKFQELGPAAWVQGVGRLVRQEGFGLDDQDGGRGGLTFLSLAQALRRAFLPVGQAHPGKHPFYPFLHLFPRKARLKQGEGDVILQGGREELYGGVLKDRPHPPVQPTGKGLIPGKDRPAEEAHFSLLGEV